MTELPMGTVTFFFSDIEGSTKLLLRLGMSGSRICESKEREVLDLTAHGCADAAIAEQLVRSPKTVRNHVSNIFSKLQVAGRAEAIIRVRDAGMGTSGA